MIFTALYNQNCPTEMSYTADDYEDFVKTGIYRHEFQTQAYFLRAFVHFKAHEWDAAGQNFDLAIQSATDKSPFKIWSLLYKGYVLDLQDKREEAVRNYEAVLNAPARWKSHDFAKERLKQPFDAGDAELTTLLL